MKLEPSNPYYPQKLTSLLGLGLRAPHYNYILQQRPYLGFFEALTENYFKPFNAVSGRPLEVLKSIRQNYPVVLHGVSMSIGSDTIDWNYLRQLKSLIMEIEPLWVSDHLCWTGFQGENLHDLLPLPYTGEAITLLCEKIHMVQDFLKMPLVLENVSAYIAFKESEMTEWEFLSELVRQSGCKLLLDVNNIYVSSINQNFNALDYLKGIPKSAIQQIHLAGHQQSGNMLIDTHNQDIHEGVWDLFAKSVQILGKHPTMIERDDNIPSFESLYLELMTAEKIMNSALLGLSVTPKELIL